MAADLAALGGHQPGVNVPRTGDWYHDRGIWLEVGTVDPGGQWAMIHCTIPPVLSENPFAVRRGGWAWDKEQPTPGGTFPAGWTRAEPPGDEDRASWPPVPEPAGRYRGERPCGTTCRHGWDR